MVRRTLYVKLGILVALGVIAGACYLRLAAGPVSLQDYAGRVGDSIAERIGPGWRVTLSDTRLELFGAKPAVRADGLEITNPTGQVVVRAPFAVVSLDPVSLLTGTFSPREIELRDLQIRGLIARDGSLTFEPQTDGTTPRAPPPVPPASSPAEAVGSPVARAVASLLDPIVTPTGVVGALDRAKIVGARLTLVDADGRERAAFHRVEATFERLEGGARKVELELDGAHGAWRVQGEVGDGPDRKAELEAVEVPLADVMLLSGLSSLPTGADFKLSGRVSAAFSDGRLTVLDGRFATSAGEITRSGRTPIRVERASGDASWDEARGVLRLASLDILSEGTTMRLAGELTSGATGGWQLKLAGRDTVVAGLMPKDAPFRVDSVSAEMSFGEGGVTLDRAAVKGDSLDLEFTGAMAPGQDGPTLQGTLEARRTDVRRLVRIWPDTLNPGLRDYLAQRLSAGIVERLRLRAKFDSNDFRAAFSEVPLSEPALDLKYVVSGAELAVVDGLPPLRDLAIEGRSAGTKASLLARTGRIDMPDGRRLSFLDASYVHNSLDRPNAPADISFRIAGGADALVSLLRSPALRDAVHLDLDPAGVKGRAEFTAKLPLVPGRIPGLAEMPLSVTGTITDFHADKLFGRERLEAATLSVGYDSGALSVRGEGRLGGSPATFEVSASKGGSPEVAVATILDDAARLRRSLPGPPLLSGPVPVRIAATLASGKGLEARVEADLSRAAIDGLVPGWVKPAGKPGRVAFRLVDGDTPELLDLTVEAGPVQIKGQAALAASGGVEHADIGSLRISPGDDMRAQVERPPGGPMKVTLKGNVGDARPMLRWITGSSQKTGGREGGGRETNAKEQGDVDLDLGVNILTGFNDEAMTGVTAKVSARGGELRSVQFSGRIRTALVEAQLAKRDSGSPALTVRSADAGATLRFLDIYRRMAGGRLAIDGRSGTGIQEGRVTVEDFGLRGEPALGRIVNQASSQQVVPQGQGDERGMAPVAQGDADQVLFNRLTADFRRSASRIDYSDVVIYGAQVGFNLSGFVDYARDRLDVSGTFVPAYLINNAFSQLPVVGILLGGGRNEGLIAVDFRVAGTVASPTLTVNPLTVVAPGILRKLFGWMMPEGEQPRMTGSAGAGRAGQN